MKYIVSGGATLSLADGTKFALAQGIHDGSAFPTEVKKHWAFKVYARPLDEVELEQEKQAEDLAASLVMMAKENNSLKARLVEHEKTIADQGGEITNLKAQLDTAKPGVKTTESSDKTDDGEGVKNAKKQQTSN
jgi:hypothetical protein